MEATVLEIVESAVPGRWVLATVGGLDDSVVYELTFCPDITQAEWRVIGTHLPKFYRMTGLEAVGGELLGRAAPALFAVIG